MLKKVLFATARSRYASRFIGWTFQHGTALLPVEKLYEDSSILVFFHPAPYWRFHGLAVPKSSVPSFTGLDLSTPTGQALLVDIFRSIQRIAADQGLQRYKAQVNGGAYQDVPQLHFHFASGASKGGQDEPYTWVEAGGIQAPESGQSALCYAHPNPRRETQLLLTSVDPVPPLGQLDFNDPRHVEALVRIFALAQRIISARRLGAYAILIEATEPPDPRLCAHLISGSLLKAESTPAPAETVT